MKQTSLYEMFEIEIPGDQPEAVARNCARFRQSEGEKIVVSAFRKRAGVFAVRFLPREEGEWKYEISLFGQNISGSFCCGPAEEGKESDGPCGRRTRSVCPWSATSTAGTAEGIRCVFSEAAESGGCSFRE